MQTACSISHTVTLNRSRSLSAGCREAKPLSAALFRGYLCQGVDSKSMHVDPARLREAGRLIARVKRRGPHEKKFLFRSRVDISILWVLALGCWFSHPLGATCRIFRPEPLACEHPNSNPLSMKLEHILLKGLMHSHSRGCSAQWCRHG